MKMRILFFSVLLTAFGYSSFGQVRNEYFRSLFVDVEGNAGLMSQRLKANPFSTNYEEALNAKQGSIKFDKGWSKGFDVRLGYYFDKKRSFGFVTGVNYYKLEGNLTLDTFHIEFKSTDRVTNPGGTFRQVISTSRGIKEVVTTTSWNIPLLFSYKRGITEKFSVSGEIGILYNLSAKNVYSSDARFNYEAIYKFEGSYPVYDNSAIPDTSDFLITQKEFTAKNPKGDVKQYFKTKDSIGYSVGLNEKVVNNTGSVSYKTGSIGYTVNVAAMYKVWRNVFIRGGFYYTGQNFTNTSSNNSMQLTSKKIYNESGKSVGVDYSSLLNQVQSAFVHNYGFTLGARVYINKGAWKHPENDMNKVTPASGHGQ
jgi:hypothetical protein